METETFKITNLNDAIKMMEEMNNKLILKVVGDYVRRLKFTNTKNYKILGTKIIRGNRGFDTYYLVTNDEGRDVWAAAEHVELI